MPLLSFGCSGSASVSGSVSFSAPIQELRLLRHTGQLSLTAPASHFSLQVQVCGITVVSSVSPSSMSAIRSASSTMLRKCTVFSPSAARSIRI